MRERLAAAFGALALAVLLLAGGLRLVALQDLLREDTYAELDQHARLVAAVLDQQVEDREPVSAPVIERVLDEGARLELAAAGDGELLVVTGAAYAGDGVDDVRATEESDAGTVTLTAGARRPLDFYTDDLWSLLMLGTLVALLAGLVGWWLAVRLSAPFVALAGAAAALGRGRFDLALPRTRIPEARAIAQALQASATQLEARVSRERDFAEHTSHVLRTPLTGLLLELEDLTMRDDVPDDVKQVARRCMERVAAVDVSAGELVAMTRSAALVEGAESTLLDLARHVAQGWSDELAGRRTVSAAVEGDASLRLTPGPMEQVLDLMLADVKRGNGPARLVFVGGGGHVRVRLPPGTVPATTRRAGVDAAAALADAQGGRVLRAVDGEVEVLLPCR